ncbi:MAG: carbohydrate ABC transporter permease, partial [Acetanaerobacterium sp.]
MKKTVTPVKTFFKYALLLFVAIIQLYPLYFLFIFSLKDNTEIFNDNPMALPAVFHWENYVHVFENANIATYLKNSLIVTLVTIAISTVLATTAAFAISRMKWKLKGTALLLFLAGMMIPLH